jgi:hypothetical protein
MKTIQETVEQLVIERTPNSAEEWELLSMEAAKAYSVRVVQSIIENPERYIKDVAQDQIPFNVIDRQAIKLLVESIIKQQYEPMGNNNVI